MQVIPAQEQLSQFSPLMSALRRVTAAPSAIEIFTFAPSVPVMVFSVLRSVVMFDRRQLRSCVRLLVLGDFALFAVDGYDAAGATTSRADVVRSIVVPP